VRVYLFFFIFVLILLATFEEGATIVPVRICPRYRYYSTLYYYDIRLYLETESKCWRPAWQGEYPCHLFLYLTITDAGRPCHGLGSLCHLLTAEVLSEWQHNSYWICGTKALFPIIIPPGLHIVKRTKNGPIWDRTTKGSSFIPLLQMKLILYQVLALWRIFVWKFLITFEWAF
jgi:hypothetical protein